MIDRGDLNRAAGIVIGLGEVLAGDVVGVVWRNWHAGNQVAEAVHDMKSAGDRGLAVTVEHGPDQVGVLGPHMGLGTGSKRARKSSSVSSQSIVMAEISFGDESEKGPPRKTAPERHSASAGASASSALGSSALGSVSTMRSPIGRASS